MSIVTETFNNQSTLGPFKSTPPLKLSNNMFLLPVETDDALSGNMTSASSYSSDSSSRTPKGDSSSFHSSVTSVQLTREKEWTAWVGAFDQLKKNYVLHKGRVYTRKNQRTNPSALKKYTPTPCVLSFTPQSPSMVIHSPNPFPDLMEYDPFALPQSGSYTDHVVQDVHVHNRRLAEAVGMWSEEESH